MESHYKIKKSRVQIYHLVEVLLKLCGVFPLVPGEPSSTPRSCLNVSKNDKGKSQWEGEPRGQQLERGEKERYHTAQ